MSDEREKFMSRIMSNLDDALTKQNIEYHDRIVDLENALRIIARKKKLDACAAASMQAIAVSALSPHMASD